MRRAWCSRWARLARLRAEADVYFHTDAVQAAGKIPLDVKEIGCDLLTISATRFTARKAAGALFVRKGTLLQPLFVRRTA